MANSNVPDSPGLGLRLSPKELLVLNAAKIQAHSTVSLAFQRKSQRWVLRAEESGGGVVAVGHYAGFAGVEPLGLLLSFPNQTLQPNSGHRLVFAEALIRFEIFRYDNHCHILVSHHSIGPTRGEPSEKNRPAHFRRNLLLAHQGSIQPDGSILILDRSGEAVEFANYLKLGIKRTLEGTRCLVCAEAYLEKIPSVSLRAPAPPPPAVLKAPELNISGKPGLKPKAKRQQKVKHVPPNPTLEAAS